MARRGASLTNSPIGDRDGAGDRRICDESLGRCCASPQVIVKEPVQSRPHGGEISPTITSEPPTSDQHVDFGLAQLDPDAVQPFPTPVPVAAHPLGTGRARPGWRSRERRVGHDLPILHRWRGKKEPRRDGGQQPERGKRPGRARSWSNPSKSADRISRISNGRRRACAERAGLYAWVTVRLAPPCDAARRAQVWSRFLHLRLSI
jgi:hypothetical protein